jgi:putative tryptophan/tyrosine transport system substrate-binding protein
MRRRAVVKLLGTAAAWPIAARAQQGERVRRIGMLINLSENDPEAQSVVAAFLKELQRLGWIEGRSMHIDARWSAGNAERIRQYASELVGMRPDAISAYAASVVRPLQQITNTVPIVFAGAIDPVAAGLVASLPRPGGNTTGFMQLEYGMSGKWLQLLKEIAPNVKRAAVLRDLSSPGIPGQFAALEVAAPRLGVALNPLDARNGEEIERAIAAFAQSVPRVPDSRPEVGSSVDAREDGLIVLMSPLAANHHELISTLAARHRLPAIYPYRYFAASGGLICYGPVLADSFRRAACYVDRILKGEKPADLPVQAPVKHELIINLRTAKALGLAVPDKLLALADEVIE